MKQLTLALLLAIGAASCGDPVAPASPTPVEATETEQFTGRLEVSGSNVHAFVVRQVGRVRITLTTLTPSAPVALAIGTTLGAACQPVSTVIAQLSGTPQLSGTATITGVFCISVTATDAMTEAAEYALTVSHP